MTTHLVSFPTVYRVAIEPMVHQPLLRALCEHTDGAGLPVSLRHEPDGPADSPAITILLDSRSVRQLLGAEPATVGQSHTGHAWRLGNIHRADPGRDALWERIADRDAPLAAFLNWERHAWRVRVYAPDPDAEDCDILF
jgi:hypothetical protein